MKLTLHLLIIHYNNFQALNRTIGSFISHGVESAQIHVFDNGSNKSNIKELVQIELNHQMKIIHSEKNLGWGKAINQFVSSKKWHENDILAISAHDALLKKADWNVLGDEFSDKQVLFLCPQYPVPLHCEFSLARSFRCKPTVSAVRIEAMIGHATLCFTRPSIIEKLPYDEECFIYGCESEIFLRAHDNGYKTIITNRIIAENPVTDSSSDFCTLAFGINSIYIAKLRFGLIGYVTRILVVAMSSIRLALAGKHRESENKRKVLFFSLRTGGTGFKEYLT